MTTQAIIESGMTFGPYPEGQCFYIEKSACYERIREGVTMVEFLLLRNHTGLSGVVWVVEAKSSSPQPIGRLKFAEFIEEIRTKLINGFLLGVAICLGRHASGASDLPKPFTTLNLKDSSFRFVLVINGHKDEWLPPLQEALSLALKSVVKSWALPSASVVVLNHAGARQHGLILPTTPVEHL